MAQVVAKLLQSPSFMKMWQAMAAAPKEKANYRLEVSSEAGVLRFSGGQSGTGYALCALRNCTVMVADKALSPTVVAHEMVHAAAGRKDVADKAGIPIACSSHVAGYNENNCGDISNKMVSESAPVKQESGSGQQP